MRRRRWLVGVVCVVCVGVLWGGVGVAWGFGGAWWHVVASSRPSYLVHRAGGSSDKSLELSVSAAEGEYYLEDEEHDPVSGLGYAYLSWDAPASQMQGVLEEFYGVGNVEVSGGVGATSRTYVITFVGALAGTEPGKLPFVYPENFESGVPLAGSVAVSRVQPALDGVVVGNVLNVGYAGADECVPVAGGGKFKDAACTEAAAPGEEGFEKSPVKVTDRLPAGLKAITVEGGVVNEGEARLQFVPCAIEAGGVVSCTVTGTGYPFGGTLPPFASFEVRVGVVVEPDAKTGELNEVGVSGAGVPAVSVAKPITISGETVPFGLEDYELTPEVEGGAVDTQAGSHPFQTTFTIAANEDAESLAASDLEDGNPAGGLTRDLTDRLPPGMIGNPQPFAHCSSAEFLAPVNECPAGSVIGVAVSTVSEPAHDGIISFTTPIFNLEPAAGEPARFGFLPNGPETPVYIDSSVRSGEDYGVNAEVHEVTQSIAFISSVVTIWGVPGLAVHNATRDGCLATVNKVEYQPCESLSESNPPAFFELPTSCAGPLVTSVEVDSWQHPGVFKSVGPTAGLPALDGCNRLPFSPSVTAAPDVPDTSTATGFTVDVKLPQEESLNAKGLGEADIRDTTVTLPAGMQVNPSGANGLQACPDSLVGFERFAETTGRPGVSVPVFTPRLPGSIPAVEHGEAAVLEPGINFCSDASKVGTVAIKTTVLKEPLVGSVYLAPQEANPFGSLFAMYIVAENHEAGVSVKLPGEVSLDPGTGRIVTTFANTPEAPVESIEVHFFGGERAPLATPAYCGSYPTTATITPWSAPQSGPAAVAGSSFQLTAGPGGSPCTPALPFSPTVTAGSTSIQAGAFTSFATTIARADGSQPLHAVEIQLPEGVTGILKGVELCGEPQASQGLCGPGSLIGETTVEAGVGKDPYTVTGGKVYLTGPYNGTGSCTTGSPGCAPFGLSITAPAKAGPYDLEATSSNHPPCDCVLTRAKVNIDEFTGRLTVATNTTGAGEIPQILEGVPLQIQRVNVTVNRANMTLNPTSCDKLQSEGTVLSPETAASFTVPFQAANCANLKFAPKVAVSSGGHASKLDGASLTFKITYPKGALGTQSWIEETKFDIPKQLPARLETLQRACLAATFETDRAKCPKESMIGHAIVHTQALPVPLKGPVYFVSYGNKKFPEAVIVLEGYGITLTLHGETFISKTTGITSATFRNTPDLPFENIEVTIPTGRYSEFGANLRPEGNYNLCGHKLTIPTMFTAQNGAEIKQDTKIAVTGCPSNISIESKNVSGKKTTLSVYVPAAGKLTASGKGVTSETKTYSGQEAQTFTLTQKKAGKLKTTIKLTFTPSKGKKQTKSLTVRFTR